MTIGRRVRGYIYLVRVIVAFLLFAVTVAIFVGQLLCAVSNVDSVDTGFIPAGPDIFFISL
jgi:hypothetical protein